jgi:hypothetical protein
MDKKKKKMTIIVSVIAVLCLASIVIVAVGTREVKVSDFSGKDPNEIAGYFRSEEFNNLEQQDRRKVARQVINAAITERAKEYSELPYDQRIDYLDKLIDEQEKRRKEFGLMRPGAGERGQSPNRPAPEPGRMRQRLDRSNSTTRAQRIQLISDVRGRRRERGMDDR